MSEKEKTPAEQMRELIDLTRKYSTHEPEEVAEIYFWTDYGFGRLHEGKFISGRFDRNIRIDNANYGPGDRHAHVLGRKGNEVGIVKVDGTGSHGTKCRLHPDDAAALRANGFNIHADRIVEWISLDAAQPQFLIG